MDVWNDWSHVRMCMWFRNARIDMFVYAILDKFACILSARAMYVCLYAIMYACDGVLHKR